MFLLVSAGLAFGTGFSEFPPFYWYGSMYLVGYMHFKLFNCINPSLSPNYFLRLRLNSPVYYGYGNLLRWLRRHRNARYSQKNSFLGSKTKSPLLFSIRNILSKIIYAVVLQKKKMSKKKKWQSAVSNSGFQYQLSGYSPFDHIGKFSC